MMVEQLELRNKLQTLWQDLSPNPRNRALTVANVVSHHGDEETIRLFVGLIERQTPPCDERDRALELLQSPPPPEPVSTPAALFQRPDSAFTAPIPTPPQPVVPLLPDLPLEQRLEALWQKWAHNLPQRALAVARMVAHHAGASLYPLFAQRIAAHTPPCEKRDMALRLLQTLPSKAVSRAPAPSKIPPSSPIPGFEENLNRLWYEWAGNPRNRALAIAQMVAHHGDKHLSQRFAERIAEQTPPSDARDEALRLLRLSSPFSHIHIDKESPPPNPRLPVDPEVARLAIVFDCAAELRLWVVAREITRSEDGSGVITKKALRKALKAYDITYTSRHINRLFNRGEKLFWSAQANKNIYIRSWINVALEFAHKAAAQGIDLDLNKPGVRQMLLNVSGSLEQWEAAIYAGWISHRDGLTIARVTLSQLFGREPNTIRRWEALNKDITIRRNFVQCGDIDRYFYHLPDHTTPYIARYIGGDDKIHNVPRLRWQIPNSYFSNTFDTPRRGQAAKVRRAVNAEYPPYQERGGQCELRYLKSPKRMKRLYHSLKFRMGLKGDVNRAFYVFLGEHRRTGQGIFEITNTGFLFTGANERLPIKAEKDYLELMERKRKRDYQVYLQGEEEVKNETLISPT